jgi:hypothetical protein
MNNKNQGNFYQVHAATITLTLLSWNLILLLT